MTNKKIIRMIAVGCCVAAVVAAVAAWHPVRAEGTKVQVTTGTLEVYPEFPSKYVAARTVSVWLPEGYQKGEACDVLYMHDGQMLFDANTSWNHQEWMVDEVADSMMEQSLIRRCIVVGIDNTEKRLNELFPTKTCQYVNVDGHQGSEAKSEMLGDDYLRFLVEEVKPFVEEHYQPLAGPDHTFIMGSSMGGLISLYALCEYPQLFGGAACLSTHISMGHLPFLDVDVWGSTEVWAEAFRSYLNEHLPTANSRKVYMDRGTEDLDADYATCQTLADKMFRELGWDSAHYSTEVFKGHGHCERDWAKRLDKPLIFLLKK